MKITSLKANQTEIELNNGTLVFVSYNTPVAAFIPGTGIVTTETKYSVNTTRHINAWVLDLAGPLATSTTRPQEFFDSLI